MQCQESYEGKMTGASGLNGQDVSARDSKGQESSLQFRKWSRRE